jgi:hypothetical protein
LSLNAVFDVVVSRLCLDFYRKDDEKFFAMSEEGHSLVGKNQDEALDEQFIDLSHTLKGFDCVADILNSQV